MLGAWFCVIFCCCCSSRYLCLARGFSRYLPSAAPPNLPHTACTPCSDLALQARSTTAANLECSQALACPRPSASLQDWTLCRAAAGRARPSRHQEVGLRSHRPGPGPPPEREPETASQSESWASRPPPSHVLRYRSQSWPGSPGAPSHGGWGAWMPCPIVLELCQPLVLGSDPRAAGRTASVACKLLEQVCRTRALVAWHEGELGPRARNTG